MKQATKTEALVALENGMTILVNYENILVECRYDRETGHVHEKWSGCTEVISDEISWDMLIFGTFYIKGEGVESEPL